MLILTAIAFCLCSCQRAVDSFYRQSRCEDMYVIPLIKPYGLYATSDAAGAPWLIFFRNNVQPDALYGDGANDQVPVSRFNVQNGVIYGYEVYEDRESLFFAVIADRKVEKLFSTRAEWARFLDMNHVHHDTLYEPHLLYTYFKEDFKSLPWYSQIHRDEHK